MSAHCSRYPACGCSNHCGTKCHLPDGHDKLLEKEGLPNPQAIQQLKQRISDEYNRIERGSSSIRPKRKHGTNFTPQKKRRK